MKPQLQSNWEPPLEYSQPVALKNQDWLWPCQPSPELQRYYIILDKLLKGKQVKRYLDNQDQCSQKRFQQAILPIRCRRQHRKTLEE